MRVVQYVIPITQYKWHTPHENPSYSSVNTIQLLLSKHEKHTYFLQTLMSNGLPPLAGLAMCLRMTKLVIDTLSDGAGGLKHCIVGAEKLPRMFADETLNNKDTGFCTNCKIET